VQIEQLEYIVSIAEHHSFSKAGKALHISQSAISQSITKLENELGVIIFERSHAGVKPTEAGQKLIELASEALDKISEIHVQAEKYKSSHKNQLNIGLVTGLHLPFLPKVLSQLREEFPNYEVIFTENPSLELVGGIERQEIDIAVIAIYEETIKNPHLSFTKWYKGQTFVLVPRDSPLANQKSVTPQVLKDYTFVMFKGEFMEWFFSNFSEKYGPFKLLYQSKNSESISEAVRNGLAISIEIQDEVLTNPYIRAGEIIPIPLIEEISKNSFVGSVRLNKKKASSIEQKVIELLEKEMHSFVERSNIKSLIK
jgi:LysR family transcriptional regulator, transcription activator of glutamate synthase operon